MGRTCSVARRLASLVALAVLAVLLLAAVPTTANTLSVEVESESDLEAMLEEQQPPVIAQAPVAIQQSAVTTDPSGLTPAGTTPAGGEDQSEVGLCEVCMYVLENKMQHQPYLCKGLKDPHYQVRTRRRRTAGEKQAGNEGGLQGWMDRANLDRFVHDRADTILLLYTSASSSSLLSPSRSPCFRTSACK